MDVGDAYSSLQIDDRTAILDDDTLNALFGARVAEAPDREEEFSQAVHLIKSDMQSSRQRTGANTPLPPPQYPLHEWPVGLQNIGNTCYLNSLLQFFYAVKPLRDMIQSVEAQFLEMSESASQSRKVGGATVRNSEVERAQACTSAAPTNYFLSSLLTCTQLHANFKRYSMI